MGESTTEVLQVYCKTCNVRTEAQVVGTHAQSRLANPGGDPVDSPYYVTVYKFAVCHSCGAPFLSEHDYIEVPGEFSAPQGERMLKPVDFFGDAELIIEPYVAHRA
ncbi:MAG: hypothetical protein RDU41_00215 [Clostridia bacterium]|nr:hypothetical protein [Clostridia bacterium]